MFANNKLVKAEYAVSTTNETLFNPMFRVKTLILQSQSQNLDK